MSGLVTIVDTGVANIASLKAAFDRLGYATELTTEEKKVAAADRLVLPGVGRFAQAVKRLLEFQLRQPLQNRINENRATLAICLGMQLLAQSSEESPGAVGLGIIPLTARRFPDHLQVPQLGWNEVAFDASSTFESGHAYFANSYRLVGRPEGWQIATTDYGGEFTSVLARGNILACQFHPELSGSWGAGLLRRWLTGDLGVCSTSSDEEARC